MMKIVLVLAVMGLVYLLWRTQRPRGQQPKQPTPPRRAPSSSAAMQSMVVCAHCGLHLPASDAVQSVSDTAPGTTYYCSAAHHAAAHANP